MRIVISGRARPTLPDEIRGIVPDADVALVEEKDLESAIDEAEIVATVRLSSAALLRARRLKWVQSWAAGPNAIMHEAMRRSAAVVTSCRGNGAVPLAEHAILLMLMLARQVPRLLASQAARRWDKLNVDELAGRTCGIIGTGYSGTELARRAKAFDMRVLGLRRRPLPAKHFDEVYTRADLSHFLAQSDVVAVSAALTDETRGMLGEREFRAMKPSAHYICFSRGAIAEPAALEKALRENWIAGAGLDAHAVEPLPPDSPFWTMSNVIVTPHIGAVSPMTIERGNDIFLKNLRRYCAGQPLINLVDKDAGY